jgi:hypothetical protein
MKVQPAGKQLTMELKLIGVTMTDSWLKKAGPEGKAIVDNFNAMQ